MNIVDLLTSHDSLRPLTSFELELGSAILTTNLQLLPTQKLLVVADKAMVEQEAAIWFESAKTITPFVSLVSFEGMTHSGQEPPSDLVTLCTQSEVVILQTYYSLTHTAASKQAQSRGAKVASLPGVNYAVIEKLLSIDYAPIRELGTKVKATLEQVTELTITSPFGTHLTTQVRRTNIIDDNGFIKAGEVGNLPAGEVFFCPVDHSTNGTWVINGSLADKEILDQPVTITIVEGKAVEFKGGQAARELERKLRTVGDQGLVVAEIGIGTNPAADPLASLIEAEKAYGSAHLAFGNSVGFGGSNKAPIHLDGVTLQPSIKADTKLILENNTFLI